MPMLARGVEMFSEKSLTMSFSIEPSFMLFSVVECLQSAYELLEQSCERWIEKTVEY